MAKFDPQPTLNSWTDRHQIWNTWLCRGYIFFPKNLGSIREGDSAPPYTRNIHPKPSNVYFTFQWAPSPYREGHWTNFRA